MSREISFDQIHATESRRQIIANILSNEKPLTIVTPTLILDDFATVNGQFVVGVKIPQATSVDGNVKNRDFIDLFTEIDNKIIDKISQDIDEWYGKNIQNRRLVVENAFIPTVKRIGNDLKLIVDNHPDRVCIQDHDGYTITSDDLKKGTQVRLMLELNSVQKDRHCLWINWKVMQVKARVEQKLPECLLDDQETYQETCFDEEPPNEDDF